jgi:hypothetical protein
MDDVRKKMMSLVTAFFMGLNEADKQILKSQLNTVDEVQPGHHQMNIKSPFLNGINQGKITEEQRQHFYKVLHLAEQKWRSSKGFDDPEKMKLLMEKRGMGGVLESISCEPIDMGFQGEFYYPVRTNADQFEIEKIVNIITGEETIRPYTAEEIAAVEASKAKLTAEQAKIDSEQAAKAEARQAILDRLGLTADEAALLLGAN